MFFFLSFFLSFRWADTEVDSMQQREATRVSGDQSPSLIPPIQEGKSQNEVLSAFFNSLMKKKGASKSGT